MRAHGEGARVWLLTIAAAFALACGIAGRAEAAPTPRFVASPVQGSVCAAPCIVHLDATATTSTDHTRPFHELDYAWDCGEPGAGTWANRTAGDRNLPRGPVSGCVYATPGAKTIRLTVREPDGETATAQSTVTVADPNALFPGTSTVCISASGNFSGCPTGAQQVTSSDFDAALTANTGCNADAVHKRCLLRCGESFVQDQEVSLSAAATPALLSCYGGSGRARVTASTQFGFGVVDRGWTVSRLDWSGTVAGAGGMDLSWVNGNVTLYDNALTTRGGSSVTHQLAGDRHPDLVAIVGDTHVITPLGTDRYSQHFFRARRQVLLGNVFDANGEGEFVIRSIHTPLSAIQHNELLDPQDDAGNVRNPLQLRAFAQASGTGLPRAPTQYVVVSDNLLESQMTGSSTGSAVRLCQENGCNASPGEGENMIDVLLERNLIRSTSSATNANAGVFYLQGGRITVRNNVVDLQGMDVADDGVNTLVSHRDNQALCPNCVDDEIVVQGNTVYWDEASPRGLQFCDSTADGSTGHVCQLNLAWLPNDRGTRLEVRFGSFATGGNLFAASNPFAALPRDRGLTTAADFLISATSAARNRLASLAARTALPRDAGLRCRLPSATGAYDAGAWEQGATDCSGSVSPPAVCGNGVRETGEQCDDGNLAGGDGCSAACRVEVCGNGIREGAEQCDDGNLAAGDGCSAACRTEVCGNRVLDPGETCDDGNTVAGDGCSAICRAEACGNGVRDGAEQCDDGNGIGGDGCRPNCTVEACGDGFVDGAEQCDDGNFRAGDGCSAACVDERAATPIPIYVNLGGGAYADANGGYWLSAPGWVENGRTAATLAAVAGTTNDALYWSRVVGAAGGPPLTIEVPIAGPGSYRVALHYAELEGRAPGQRVFDVELERAFVVEGVDVAARVGLARAWVQELFVNADDRVLTVRLLPRVGEPMLSGLEITAGTPPVESPRFVPEGCDADACP